MAFSFALSDSHYAVPSEPRQDFRVHSSFPLGGALGAGEIGAFPLS